jgi:AraC-like DNA-binding protein
MRFANDAYCAIFQQQVDRALARLPRNSGTADAVRSAARAALAGGSCSLEGTARVLGMSARTLQRRLHADGTSFGALLDALRRELADEYLARQLSIPEIAWLLGYAEPSAFHHAFKRWTGTSPEQARARSATQSD